MRIFIFIIAALTLASVVRSDDNTASRWVSYSNNPVIEARVDSLLQLMTLEEKIGQMTQFSANWSITGPVMSDDFKPYLERG